MTDWYALILAAGSGTRMQSSGNKVFLDVCGQSVLERSIRAIAPFVQGIILVTRKEDMQEARAITETISLPCSLEYTTGGATRQDSVECGLRLIPENCTFVMIHDAARCLVSEDLIRRVMQDAERNGSAIPAIPVTDTIKVIGADQRISTTPDRNTLFAVQTPQALRVGELRKAFAHARETGFQGTDDASLLEHAGFPVYISQGERSNLKITMPEDLGQARRILRTRENESMSNYEYHVGYGYDVHQFAAERKLILCGIEVPYTRGLLGHSDADVALHALMDAMLGSAALGDIGHLFPDTDPAYLGISSILLLQKTVEALKASKASVIQADLCIVAQKPKLAPYIDAMRERIAQCLGLPVSKVSVKATTTEHLGFEGREEGISATAVVMTRVET